MYFVNCVSNPFLYSLLSQSFRTECHILLSNMVKFSPNFKKWFVKAEDYGCCQENNNKSNSMVVCENEKVSTALINPVTTIDIIAMA